jgi:DNA polymerase III epsilon subunit-like protein
MEAETYSNAEVIAFSNKTYVNVKLDGDQQGDLRSRFGITAYPSAYVVTPEGEILGRIEGFEDPRPYVERLKKIDAGHQTVKALLAKSEKTIGDWKELAAQYAALDLSSKSAECYRTLVDHPQADRPTRAQAYAALLDIGTGVIRSNDDAWLDWLDKLATEVETFDPENALDLRDDAACARTALQVQKRELEAALKSATAASDRDDPLPGETQGRGPRLLAPDRGEMPRDRLRQPRGSPDQDDRERTLTPPLAHAVE